MLAAMKRLEGLLATVPKGIGLLIARFVLATIFWRSGQTKIDGLSIDILSLEFELGWPRFAESTLFLFEHEYMLPLMSPYAAALIATLAEHILPLMLLVGLFTRSAALALLCMTLVIQIFVYPEAWVTHGLWVALLLLLISSGAGGISADRVLGLRQAPN